jgi:von Hippel-Lindau disease tumor suppressor protein
MRTGMRYMGAALLTGTVVVLSTGFALGARSRPNINHRAIDAQLNCSGRSPGSNRATSILFVNSTKRRALVYWLSFRSKSVLYNRLPAHKQYLQRTYVGHKWVVYESGRCIATTVATKRHKRFVIH